MILTPTYVRTRYSLRIAISHIPWIYFPLSALKRAHADGRGLVTEATDVVIEAFPRSGNTFAVVAFRSAQTTDVNVAHHCHAPAQLIRAARLGKPSLLIVRRPKDATLSFVIRHPEIPIKMALKAWIAFHHAVLPCKSEVVIARFDDVASDFGLVTRRLNERFNTRFASFDHTATNVEACFNTIEKMNADRYGKGKIQEDSVARPSDQRLRKKQDFEDAWRSLQPDELKKRAQDLYDKLTS